MVVRRKENYPMRKLDVPKRVTLPNGRTFYARYERIKRQDLPAEIQKILNSDLALLDLGQAIKIVNRLLNSKPPKPKIAPKPIGLA